MLTILYRDEHVVFVDKPSGMLVHRGWGDDAIVALTVVRDLIGREVHPVHRLDRGTSGVLLFALSSEAARALGASFEASALYKRYVALVRGAPPAEVHVDHPIPRTEGGPRVPAETTIRTLAVVTIDGSPLRETRYAIAEAIPRTGRLHQVRRHLKHAGHPILGDANYGKQEHTRFARDRFGLRRLALHAEALHVRHPATGQLLRVHAPMPADLTGPLERMGFDPAGLPPSGGSVSAKIERTGPT